MTLKEIPNFPRYFASKSGKIWSEKSKKYLHPDILYNGRLRVTLYKNGNQHRKYVHRLILETFIGPCLDEMECCHNNGNPSDNKLGNLRWSTRSENMKDAFRHGTKNYHGENGPSAKLNRLQVRIIRRLLEFGILYQREIGEIFNVSQALVSCIKTRRHWRYI